MLSYTVGRRRSSRILQEHLIEVAGTNIDGVDFLANSRTLLLSRYGAKIHLDQGLGPDQQISVYNPTTGSEGLAKVVALYDQDSGGYLYGIEFLDSTLDFWRISFPLGPEPGAVQAEKKFVVEPEIGPGTEQSKSHQEAPSERPPVATKNYLLRMKCPHGVETTWILLRNREEHERQVLDKAWDFPCPRHGLQREFPMQVHEAPEGFQSQSWLEAFIPVDLSQIEAQHRKQRKNEIRTSQALKVWVSGVDLNGNPFSQSAYSMDVSNSGARLHGIGFLTSPGKRIQIKHGWKKALFCVIWVGEPGSYQSDQVGVRCLQPGKNIWGIR